MTHLWYLQALVKLRHQGFQASAASLQQLQSTAKILQSKLQIAMQQTAQDRTSTIVPDQTSNPTIQSLQHRIMLTQAIIEPGMQVCAKFMLDLWLGQCLGVAADYHSNICAI